MKKKRLVFTVTNDLTYDQRMIRICTSLHDAGYEVTLVGRREKGGSAPPTQPFKQVRLLCRFRRGPLFYAAFNLQLLVYLLRSKFDLICAIDLDTILPCLLVAQLKGVRRVYDAHELFCEMKEIVSRKRVHTIWKSIERFTVPKFPLSYTVNDEIATILRKEYRIVPEVIRNISRLEDSLPAIRKENFIMYQGAVNHGRSFETLLPAFKNIDVPLFIYGDGNFLAAAKDIVKINGLESKVFFKGKLPPQELRRLTPAAVLGITLFENTGLSNYYSLANRFFDYIHARVPQICVNFPVYRSINEDIEVAVLVDDLSPGSLATVINATLSDEALLQKLERNCAAAQLKYNWQEEEKKLLHFYRTIFA
jgi:glycosyltransferase involved in cell wall biosynthesis